MNTKIFAYPMAPTATYAVLDLPMGAQVLAIDINVIKGGILTLWAMVNPNALETEQRVFCRFDVGAEIPKGGADLIFIGRTIGLGKSEHSHPGGASFRNTFWFEATGKRAQEYVDIHEAVQAAAS